MKVTARVENWLQVIDSDRAKFTKYLQKMPPGTMLELEVNRMRWLRSVEQNKYYWAIIVQMLSDYLGNTPQEMHDILKYLHNPKEMTLPSGEIVREGESTTKLDTKEAEAYFERIRIWAQQDLNFIIPLPNA